MDQKWSEIYESIKDAVCSTTDTCFFRGHADANWKLLPSLARVDKGLDSNLEKIAYFDFLTRAGTLLQEGTSDWNIIFSMQHHGFPTRLLDWTESFPIALYFALKNASEECCVWMLDPFELNYDSMNDARLFNPSDLKGNYSSYFLEDNAITPEGDVIAISPLRHHPRISSQKAGFTLHSKLTEPLEDIHGNALKKYTIPKSAQKEAALFLKLAGVSEYTIFPDLDGLARELAMEHYGICN